MKFTKLSSAAIVAALALGVLAPTAALAAPTEVASDGTVIVTEGGDEESPGVVDPENPDVDLPPTDKEPGEVVNPDLGALMIERTSNLDFGTIKTSASDVTAYALATSFGGGTAKRGAYVQWRDIRAGGTYGYTVTAEMTQQFTGATSNKLNASTIDFSNGFAVADGDNTNTVPSNVKTAFQLTEDGGAQTIVTADKAAGEGKGLYIMAFGDSRDSTEANSVKLTVPAATASNMAVDTYTAKVTWKIVAAL